MFTDIPLPSANQGQQKAPTLKKTTGLCPSRFYSLWGASATNDFPTKQPHTDLPIALAAEKNIIKLFHPGDINVYKEAPPIGTIDLQEED